jgi:hypothetical protein
LVVALEWNCMRVVFRYLGWYQRDYRMHPLLYYPLFIMT